MRFIPVIATLVAVAVAAPVASVAEPAAVQSRDAGMSAPAPGPCYV